MAEKVFFLLGMDCERIDEEAPGSGGPVNYELSERSIKSLAEMGKKFDVKVSFYPMPEMAKYHSSLFLELERDGFALGHQFHATCFRDFRWTKHLGFYSKEEQYEIISLATDDWAQAIGKRPLVFRCGNGSASDDTYPVLEDLGYKVSSSSMPGRYNPETHALWVGKFPFPHHTNRKSRLVVGDMDLYEIPVTKHPNRYLIGTKEPHDLRPDRFGRHASIETYKDTIDAWLELMKQIDPPVKTIVVGTHNTIDFDRDFRRQALEFVITYSKEAVEKEGYEFVPATMMDVRAEADRIGAF